MLKANYAPSKWRGVDIKKGSFVSSFANLSQSSGLTIRELRTSLSKLKSTNDMTSLSTSEYTMFTVVNYTSYQSSDIDTDKPKTNERQTKDKRTTTIKEDKEYKEIIYSLYPSQCPVRNSSNGKSAKDKDKIEALLKTNSFESLKSIIERYTNDCVRDQTYMKNFSTFLNNLPDYTSVSSDIKPRINITRDVWHIAKQIPAEMNRLCELYNLTTDEFKNLYK